MALDVASLRKAVGGKLEEALNKLLDENLKGIGKEMLKREGHKLVDSLVDKHYEGLLGGVYEKLKGVVDMIDGEKNNAASAAAPAAVPKVKGGSVTDPTPGSVIKA